MLVLQYGLLCVLTLIGAVSDIRRMIIPDGVALLIAVAGLFAAGFLPSGDLGLSLLGGALGGALLLALRWAHFRLRGVEGLGLGDVKFTAAGGLWTGAEDLPAMLAMASCTALAYLACRWLLGRPITTRDRVPFAPFLGAGLLLVVAAQLFAGSPIFDLVYRL